MFHTSIFLADEAATERLGAHIAPVLAPGDVVALSGPLGAGKSALARAIIAALTGVGEAPSPTFGLAHHYDEGPVPVWHFDLYRLKAPDEVWELGLEEALGDGVCLIEWAERIASWLPASTLLIDIDIEGSGRRAILRGEPWWGARIPALTEPV